jgi:hypothetical protein
MDVINKLVDRGNSVLVIEHNLDVIKMADHVIDLGPEGGDGGGTILFEGTPEVKTLGSKNQAKITTTYRVTDNNPNADKEVEEEVNKSIAKYSKEQLAKIDISELTEYTKGVINNEKIFQILEKLSQN